MYENIKLIVPILGNNQGLVNGSYIFDLQILHNIVKFV